MKLRNQTTAPDQLAGGQSAISDDNEQYSRSAQTRSVVFPLSGKQGVNVEGSNPRLASPTANNRDAATVGGMAVGSPVSASAKPVDSKTIQGSYPGDHRAPSQDTAKASLFKAADNGGPRASVGQFPNGKRDATLGSFSKDSANESYPGNTADSDAGN